MTEPARALVVRDCEPADIEDVTAIYQLEVLHGSASFETEPPDVAEMERRRQALWAGGHPHLVALRGGELAGYAYAGPYRSRAAYRSTVENAIYVGEGFRRMGVARILLSALIDEASRRGFRQMIAVIGDSANAASIGLHERLGFGHVGVLGAVGWKHGRWLDTVLMQRALGTGHAAPAEPPP